MDEAPQFTDSVICPMCGGAIPAVKMEVRFIARYTCPACRNDVVIKGEKPIA